MKKISFAALAMVFALSAGLSRTGARANQSDLLHLLPDGKFVAVADMQQVTKSSFWTTLAAENKIKKVIDEVQSKFGEIGLRLEDLSALALVGSSSSADTGVMAVSGSFNQASILSSLRANPKIRLTSEKYRGFDVFEVTAAIPDGKNDRVAFAFYDSSTAVVGSLAGVRTAIDVRAGERPSVAQNAKLNAALAQTPPAAVRFAMETTSGMSRLNSANLPLPDFASIKLIFGTVDFTSAIEINATLRSEAAGQAKAIGDQLNSLLGMARGFLGVSGDPKMASLGEMLKTVTVTVEETDVKISGNIPAEVLAQLFR
ncbi:MAG: hypothetical protein AB1631_31040 [Acidobacteriota bacterium]